MNNNEISISTTPDSELAVHPPSQNPAAVYLASLQSFHSRRTMKAALVTIAAILMGEDPKDQDARKSIDIFALPWQNVAYQHSAAVAARLATDYAPATANKILSALRSVLKECWRLGLMDIEVYNRAVDIKNVRGETVPTGRDLASGEILALVEACKRDETAAGVRDAAIIGVLYTCGLRRAEAATLTLSDYDHDTGRLVVKGKGNKQRTVYVINGAKTALDKWIHNVRNLAPGPLFMPVLKSGRVKHASNGITSQAIYNMLLKREKEAGVKAFSPHDFRRTFVGDLLDRGNDIVTVQKLAGHASPTTTSRYDRRGEEAKQKAAATLHFPY